MKVNIDSEEIPGIKSIYEAVIIRIVDDLVRDGKTIYGGTDVEIVKPIKLTDGYAAHNGQQHRVTSEKISNFVKNTIGEKVKLVYKVDHRKTYTGFYLYGISET